MQFKKTQVHVSVWGLLMASQKHCKALLDALNGKEVPIETTVRISALKSYCMMLCMILCVTLCMT